MSMNGADIERLRTLAKKFNTEAGHLETLINHLQTATRDSEGYWKGGKANNFRSEWEQLKPTFDRFVKTLHDAHDAANTNADNIDRATN
jgi:WXG100 family type VII secretion target